jgi:hypothetical protein
VVSALHTTNNSMYMHVFVHSRPVRLLYNAHKVYYTSKSNYSAPKGAPVHDIYTVPPTRRSPHRGPPIPPLRGYKKRRFDFSWKSEQFFCENQSFYEKFSFFLAKSVAPVVVFNSLAKPVFTQVTDTTSARLAHASPYFSNFRQNLGYCNRNTEMELQWQLKGHVCTQRHALSVRRTVFEYGGDRAKHRSPVLFQRPVRRILWIFFIFS